MSVALMRMAVGTSVAAGLRTRPQSLGHDLPDRPCAAAALSAATQAAIDLPGRTRNPVPHGHGVSNVMVAQDIAGADNHEGKQTPGVNSPLDRKPAPPMQRESEQFEAIPNCRPAVGPALNPGSRWRDTGGTSPRQGDAGETPLNLSRRNKPIPIVAAFGGHVHSTFK